MGYRQLSYSRCSWKRSRTKPPQKSRNDLHGRTYPLSRLKKMKEKRGESNTPQIVYSATAYRVDAGYRVGFFKNQIT